MITILDFYADWCNPCKLITSIVDNIEKDFPELVTIERIDIEDDSESVEKYAIRNIPTLVIIKDNKIIDKIVGTTTRTKIVEILNKYK